MKAATIVFLGAVSFEERDTEAGYSAVYLAQSLLPMIYRSKRSLCYRKPYQTPKKGVASHFEVYCCEMLLSFFYTCSKIENKQAFEVNRRAVLAMRNIGVGLQGLVKFTCVMNMLPPMNENSYRDHVKALRNAAESVVKASMSKAAAGEVKEFYEPAEDGLYDIAVCGDWTWRKRGFLIVWGGDSPVNNHRQSFRL